MKKVYMNYLFPNRKDSEKSLTVKWAVLILLFALTLLSNKLFAQQGLIHDDFSEEEIPSWVANTTGATSELVEGQLVITMALQGSGKYRGDVRKEGGAVIHAGNYPILAVKFNKPPKCAMFLDTNLGSYNSRNNNHRVIQTPTGNIYYWDLSAGTLGSTSLPLDQSTALSLLQFKVADVELTQEQLANNDIQYEMDWVRTFTSMDELRAQTGTELPAPFEFTGSFSHPGLLHDAEDLLRIKGFVDNEYGRPFDSYQLLQSNSKSSFNYTMGGPFTSLTRDNALTVDGVNGGTVKNRVESDFLAAYYNALMWNITGNEAHALKSIEIIDAYANTTQDIVGRDAELNGLYGFILANAAELIRHTYDGWSASQASACEDMLQNVFYPVLENFKSCSHGNWDHASMKALMAIAIFSEDYDMFDHVINYFYHGEGNGSIDNYVLTEAGQLQESNRDQPHTMLALGSLAEMAEIGLKQGIDLYEASQNAIMRGFEYTSQYNLGYDVPYETQYDYCEWNYQDYTPESISDKGRGQFRAVFEIAFNHYVYREGLEMPYTLEVLAQMGPEGAPFGADNPGYGSLFFYLNEEPNHSFDALDPETGLIDDEFEASADGWAVATSGASLTVQDGQLNVDMVKLSNGKYRGDLRKPDGETLYPKNYPILAIKMTRPGDANITFDTNLGAYRNGSNRWTGKIGEDIYYYDLKESGFGSGPTYLSTTSPTDLTTFQFKVADVTTGDSTYTVDWVKTFESLEALELSLLEQQTITFEPISTKELGYPDFEPVAHSSSGLTLSFISSDTAVAKIVNGKIHLVGIGSTEITAQQEGDTLYAPAQPVSQILHVVDPEAGLIDDEFEASVDGWAVATSGASLTVQDGQLNVDMVKLSNGKYRGDIRKPDGATLYPTNYPILAIKMTRPGDANITFDTNLGAFRNGSNRWTGRLGEDVYYFDMEESGFGSGPTYLSDSLPTSLSTFQFKVADVTTGDSTYTVDWLKTFKSLDDLKEFLKLPQTISFEAIAPKKLGDLPFVPEVSASSSLEVGLSSSNTSVAVIEEGEIKVVGAGTTEITAVQAGNEQYTPAEPISQTLLVTPFDVQVTHRDGNKENTSVNQLMPQLSLVNNDTVGLAYQEVEVRYWLTPENYAGIDTWVDYSAMGNEAVSLEYVELEAPRQDAFGYLSYRFPASTGKLVPQTSSGEIHSRAANTDWSVLNIENDFSYSNTIDFELNENISLYRNGVLVFGNEPQEVAKANHFKVLSRRDGNKTDVNQISFSLQVLSEGNMPVDYQDVEVRYWFTREGEQDLVYVTDYAMLGAENIEGNTVKMGPVQDGADTYLQLNFEETLGTLAPLSNTGEIKFRIYKSDWSNFEESNDHSFLDNKDYEENPHITVYHQGELVYGTVPTEGVAMTSSEPASYTIYPNPLQEVLHIESSQTPQGTIEILIHNNNGEIKASTEMNTQHFEMDVSLLGKGIYVLTIQDQDQVLTEKLIKR